MARVLYVSPFGQKMDSLSGRSFDFDYLSGAIKAAIQRSISDVMVVHLQDLDPVDVEDHWRSIDLVLCDITTLNPNCLYQLGFARGRGKPAIIIAAKSNPIPFDLTQNRVIIYDPDALSKGFFDALFESIQRALANPNSFIMEEASKARRKKIFVSYSHKDKEYLDRMLVHLKPLEAAGLIDPWVDIQLKAGDHWKQKIGATLQSASVAILLISADFLASDFIVKNELPPILTKAETGGTRIIPIILKPCRFARDTNLSKFQSLNTPDRPLSTLTDSEREQIFDSLAASLEESVPVV